MKPVKVKFKKIKDSNTIYETYGYYTDQKDFETRNPTMFFDSMTKKTKPIPIKKEKEWKLSYTVAEQ